MTDPKENPDVDMDDADLISVDYWLGDQPTTEPQDDTAGDSDE